ncbi:hypothetical protein ABD91_20130 [Lysinibacillus sphaericus]|uniref:hypothetical protein n=1 Tax=Lysinibacillus sphaericus TaxID=1421 RepID=UPI0018CFC470|nr:hypothetical protein [Lysinibacillus sphaericus]MBG9693068.1 hypothetical protein [Lysinibacillus sphaericus]
MLIAALVVFLSAWLFVVYYIIVQKKLDKMGVDRNRFGKPFYNWLYTYAHVKPLSWFVDDDNELTTKGEKIKKQLVETGHYNVKFVVRSYMAFQIVVFAGLVLVGLIVCVASVRLDLIYKLLLNVDVAVVPINFQRFLMIIMIVVLLGLVPGYMLKSRAKKIMLAKEREVPMIMMFVILMLRSGKSTGQIMNDLAKVKSMHQQEFEKAALIYARSPESAIEYLKGYFGNSAIADMFELVSDVTNYSRNEVISIIESNMKSYVGSKEEQTRRKDLTSQVYSQATMAVPFSAVILLGVLPLLGMAFASFTSLV